MTQRRIVVTALSMALAVVVAPSVGAQQQVASIDPGMSRAQVIERLGQPLSARSFETFTYLLYRNGCEKKCGMNDLVVLDSGKVVDAVFRSPSRKYTGASSSPKMIDANAAKRGTDAAKPPAPKKKPT